MPPFLVKNRLMAGVDFSRDLGYEYPDGLDLRPNSKLHQRIVEEVMLRATESNNFVRGRRTSWDEVDKTLTAYKWQSDKEDEVKEKDPRKPTSIVVPLSYATLDTLLTYMVAAFFESPVFKYAGVGSEDIIGAALLERVVGLHTQRFKAVLNLHTMFRDAMTYGFGVVLPFWKVLYGTKTVRRRSLFGFGPERAFSEEGVIFEGNALNNVDPKRYLPDPNVSIHDPQAGEFLGWIQRVNYMKLLEDEKNSEGEIFNVKYLEKCPNFSSHLGTEFPDYRDKDSLGNFYNPSVSSTRGTVIWMYITLVPKDWKLGDGEYPEKWLFGVAGDALVIKAQPLGLNHNMYPAAVVAPDFDGYSPAPTSRIEINSGLQTTMDWLFNSHVANVRKAINDMLLVDPSLVNMADLTNPEPGKLVRMRRSAWGRGVEHAVQQLHVTDVTKGHIQDAMLIRDLMQVTSGAVDVIQGIHRGSSERVSSAEAQGVRQAALSRLEKVAKIMWHQGLQDIAYMFAVHTQQLMTEETYVKLAGRYEEELRRERAFVNDRYPVSPLDLAIDFDIEPHDGTAPGNENIQGWIQVLQSLSANPNLAPAIGLDLARIYMHVMRQLGARGLEDFRMQPPQMQLMPDEAVMQNVQAGNIVPIGAEG